MWVPMTDEKERVDWAALMDAHGIAPDADTRGPAVEPDLRAAAEAPSRRSRTVAVIIAVTALFSIAASVAVLVALLRGGERDGGGRAAAAQPEASGPRPAAFEQSSDGVIIVPPVGDEPAPEPPVAAEPPAAPAPAATADRTADRKPERRPDRKPEKPTEPAAPAGEPPPEAPAANLPDEPDQAAVASAMEGLEKDITACAAPAGVKGEVGIKMRIEPDGKVAWAAARLQNSPFQSCLDRLFKKARMPRSVKGATVRQTVQLP